MAYVKQQSCYVLRNKAKYTSERFSGVGRLDFKTIEK